MSQAEHLGTFIYKYEDGPTYRVKCASDTSVHWECLEGDDKGRSAEEVADRVEIAPRIHFLSWVETDGVVVTQVLDFATQTVTCTVVAGGERYLLQGRVERFS